MRNSKLELKTPDEAETVFYEAFMHCDKDVMAALWADGDVFCVHPGSGAIAGYDAVTRSWVHIFSNAQQTEMKYTVANRTETNELAVHLVVEEILNNGAVAAVVLATNVYQKFDNGWLMIEHHGSLVQSAQKGQTLQ